MSGKLNWREVAAHSRQLSDSKLLQMLSLIEMLPQEQRPDHVLDAMRPRLAKLRPPRLVTLQRLLFNPIEDLFDPPVSYRRKIGRLSRRTIPACWNAVTQMADPRWLARLQADLKSVDTRNYAAVNAIGRELWPEVARIMRRALEVADRDRKACIQLFGRDDDTLRQVADFADVLDIGFEIENAKAQLPPKPIDGLSEGQVQVLRESISRLGATDAVQARTFALVLAARMIRPGHLLEALTEAKLNCSPTDRDQMVKDCGVAMVANLIRESNFLKDVKDLVELPTQAAAQAKRLVDGFASVQQALRGRLDTSRIEGVAQAQRNIATFILDSVVGKADEAMTAALEGRSATVLEGGNAQDEAEDVARCLRDCAQMSDAVGVRREVSARLETLCRNLERRSQESGLARDERDERLVSSARLIELIQGPEAAERMLLAYLESKRD